MGSVFISYAREDSEIVRSIAEGLADAGFDAWWDAELRGGEVFPERLEEEIREASAFVLVHSSASAASDWVTKEVELARSGEGVGVVPLCLDREPLREELQQLHHLDFIGVGGDGPESIRSFRSAMQTLIDDLRAQSPTQVLLDLANSNDVEEREEAAFLLGQARVDDERAVDRLMEMVEDVDEELDVRFEAARALGKLGVQKAVAVLRKRLNDDDPDLVAASLTSLGMLGADDCIEEIRDRIEADDRFVRESAARALGTLDAVGHLGALIDLMRNDPISVVRDAAAQSLWLICEQRETGGNAARRALKAIHRGGYTLSEVQEGCRRAADLLEQRAWHEPEIHLAAVDGSAKATAP